MRERLDKFLASQGLGTRKEVGKLIRSGAVLVNGAPQRDPDQEVDRGAGEGGALETDEDSEKGGEA